MAKKKAAKKTTKKVTKRAPAAEPEPVEEPEPSTTICKPPMMTPQQHADRVLALGPKRAYSLLRQARRNKNWSHVDWDMVAERLKTKDESHVKK